jgi:hypothetical protein
VPNRKKSGLLMSSLYKEVNALNSGAGVGVSKMQGAKEQLTLSKGPEWMGNSPA